MRRKAPDALPWLALLLDRIDVQLAHTAAAVVLQQSRLLIEHAGDAQILASALSAEVDYFVTLDREHFLAWWGQTSEVCQTSEV